MASNKIKVWVFVVIGLVCSSANGQWVHETLVLNQGWNAVWFTYQPEPADCELLFAGLPVEEVHKWDRAYGGIEFYLDPQDPSARQPNWSVWRPDSHPQSFLNDFSEVEAGEAYLIKMTSGAIMDLTGRAMIVEPDWLPNTLNLVGLPVSGSNPPTFQSAFNHTPEIFATPPDAAFYEIATDGYELRVFQPALARIDRGTAYWVQAGQLSEYVGPVKVSVSDGRSLVDFGRQLSPRKLVIQNVSNAPRLVTVDTLASDAAPVGYPVAEGSLPLAYEVENTNTLQQAFVSLPSTLSKTLDPDEIWEINLLPRVPDLAGGGSWLCVGDALARDGYRGRGGTVGRCIL